MQEKYIHYPAYSAQEEHACYNSQSTSAKREVANDSLASISQLRHHFVGVPINFYRQAVYIFLTKHMIEMSVLSDQIRTGSCLCKKVTFETKGPDINCAVCHCTNCRRNNGSTYTVKAWFPDKVRQLHSISNVVFEMA